MAAMKRLPDTSGAGGYVALVRSGAPEKEMCAEIRGSAGDRDVMMPGEWRSLVCEK